MYRHEGRGPGPAPVAPAPHGHREALEAHCDLYLGANAGVFHEIVSDRIHLDLLIHEPSDLRPFWTIVTCGVSDLPTAAPREASEYRRIELLTYLPASWPVHAWGTSMGDEAWWPARMLKDVGRLVHDHRTWLGPGHTIALGGEGHAPLAPGSLLTSVIMTRPNFEADSFDDLIIGGTPCRFLSVCPITEPEERLTLEEAPRALFDLMQHHRLPRVIDPYRACLVTGRRPHR